MPATPVLVPDPLPNHVAQVALDGFPVAIDEHDRHRLRVRVVEETQAGGHAAGFLDREALLAAVEHVSERHLPAQGAHAIIRQADHGLPQTKLRPGKVPSLVPHDPVAKHVVAIALTCPADRLERADRQDPTDHEVAMNFRIDAARIGVPKESSKTQRNRPR